MEHSKLSDHNFKKGKFVTPWNELMKDIGKENSWFHNRLPEYLWIGLIIEYYGREKGLEKCYLIIKRLHEIAPSLLVPKFSEILKLESTTQNSFYKFIFQTIEVRVLSPLTAVFDYAVAPEFSISFNVLESSVKARVETLNSILRKTSFHQTHLSTDIRFIVIYFTLLSGKLSMPMEILDLILEYPKLQHSDEKMKIIRPTIRSMEISPIDLEREEDSALLNIFWKRISKMSDCELMYPNFSEEEPDTTLYMKNTKKILEYYSELSISTDPLNSKMLVLLGISTYSYKRLLELVEHNLFNSISGRGIIRVLIEDYIMMKYLLKNESNHKDIWTEYQYYGIGQYKLIVSRFRDTNKDVSNSHVLYDYLDILVNEYIDEEFIDMDTSYFGKQNIREKAKQVGEQDLYGLYYDYDSAFEHGLWGAIRESSLIKCNSAAHQYHCVPDIENNQKLKSVWADCAKLMDKTLNVLIDTFGLPDHFAIGGENGE